MQTILGSGGAIGTELAKALRTYTSDIRLVSRNPKKVNPGDELMSADLMNLADVEKAVEGSSIVYVTVGFTYSLKIWKANWPKFIGEVIQACKDQNSKLVFFDNIYMYDPDYLGRMTEETPINPKSEKGKIRAEIAGMIMDEVRAGNLTALIARSADFYGPGIKKTSLMTELVFNNLITGKKAYWLGSVNYKHSFTYTPDAARATALLGNTEDAFNQVWHLPTSPDPFTGKQWIEAIAGELHVAPHYTVASKFMVRLMGLFVPVMKEMIEMIYQNDRDYVFDSGKFEKRFGFKPTPYLDGIREIVARDYKRGK